MVAATHRKGNSGTLSGYTKDGCRCLWCTAFWNAYQRWYRAVKRGRAHGSCPTCTCPMPPHPRDIDFAEAEFPETPNP